MYDCVHLRDACIKFNSANKYKKFVECLNSIENYLEFFDCFEVDSKVKKGDRYELTYHELHISYDKVKKLIGDMIDLCDNYGCELNLTIKIYDDGDFLLYLIAKDNKIYDITSKINKSIANIEGQ